MRATGSTQARSAVNSSARSAGNTSTRAAGGSVERSATAGSSGGKGRGRKKLRMKKSVRRTIGSLMLATSIVVAAIPVGGVSADSPDTSDYQGSLIPDDHYQKINDIDYIKCAVQDDSPAPATTVPTTGSDHYGGYPVNSEAVSYGGRNLYIVDLSGYNNPEKPRPIYSLDADQQKIEYYFENNGGDKYKPDGDLPLFIGFINDKPAAADTPKIDTWEDGGKKYELVIDTPFPLQTNESDPASPTYYNSSELFYVEKLNIYDEEEKFTVRFMGGENFDVELCDPVTVYNGDAVTEPTVFRTEIDGWTFEKWLWDWSTTIDGDKTIRAQFKAPEGDGLEEDGIDDIEEPEPTEAPSPEPTEEPEIVPTATPTPVPTETPEPEPTATPTPEPTKEPEAEPTATPTPEPTKEPEAEPTATPTPEPTKEPEAEPTATPDPEPIEEPETEETPEEEPEEVVEEEHENETAGIMMADLSGTLQEDSAPGTKYKPNPSETLFVCDDHKDITAICNDAFKNTGNIDSVVFPKNISQIGNSAFENCTNVGSIALGDGLTSLGSKAFQGCASLGTVTYSDLSVLDIIGAQAFLDTDLKTMSGTDGVISIPKNVTWIGNGAFYNTKMSKLDFNNVAKGCKVGNCAFGRCPNLSEVDLDYFDGSKLTITNLDTVEHLFGGCVNLTKANMPRAFGGTLAAGTFASCTSFNYITFNTDGANFGTFSDGEFDNRQVTVEGPKPGYPLEGQPVNLTPAGNKVKAYTSSMKCKKDVAAGAKYNDYVYRYYDGDTMHETTNVLGYTHDDDFFEKDKSEIPENLKDQKYIFDVNRGSNLISGYYYRDGTNQCDLDISSGLGPRYNGDISVLGVDKNVFENDTSVKYLQLESSVGQIGDSAFKNTQIEKMWAYVDGANFGDNAFCNNSKIVRATFAYGGPGSSTIGSNCFGTTPKLDNVDFYDDDLSTGNKDQYALFPKNSIASNAFFTTGRTKEVTFKGPMKEGYAPYEFAINPASRISNNLIYTKYYSGNPWNLTAQYKEEAFEKVNPFTGKKEWYKGVCLINYPNETSNMLYDDIEVDPLPYDPEDPSSVFVADSVEKIEKYTVPDDPDPQFQRSGMMQDCIKETHNIKIPYGIDYIDIAKSKITTYSSAEPTYFRFNDGTDLYDTDGGNYYNIFKYTPSLNSVTFEAGSVSEYPDRMFEGARNLTKVVFENDVTSLGELPFYLPDTEASKDKVTYKPGSFPHTGPGTNIDYEDKSHVETVEFKGEGGASANNEQYTISAGGLIKSNNGSRVRLAQILPGRGDLFGTKAITAEELADINEYADFAARDCDAIQSIVFPASRAKISYGCFMDCDKLKSIMMPDEVTTVGDKAFAGVSENITVTFPSDNIQLENLPFEPCNRDEDANPYVYFRLHDTAKILQTYADEHVNIEWDKIPESIKITYVDQYAPTSEYRIIITDAVAGDKGVSYPPSVEPPLHDGNKYARWEGTYDDPTMTDIPDWETTPLAGDVTFTARYDEILWNVTFVDPNLVELYTPPKVADGTEVPESAIVAAEKAASSKTVAGYAFSGWQPNPRGYTITGDKTFVAIYDTPIAPTKHKVTFVDADDGFEFGSGYVLDGNKVSNIPSPERESKVFLRWV
ncbi:MAG: leucine-rich repeat domain-containing protein, partial [Lachnospiraceae bacterium]|nr:leucine-rich repeat domain-containing protein [Lachnospiraceae bacterium]